MSKRSKKLNFSIQKIATFSLILKHLLNLLGAQIFFSVDFLNTCLLSFESPGPGELGTYLCRACETSRNFFDGLKSLTMSFQAKRKLLIFGISKFLINQTLSCLMEMYYFQQIYIKLGFLAKLKDLSAKLRVSEIPVSVGAGKSVKK